MPQPAPETLTGSFNRTLPYAPPLLEDTEQRDIVDLVWLVVPAAVGIFALRTVMIARRLKLAAQSANVADTRALREAKAGLTAHRDHLDEAIAAPKLHLAAAKEAGRNALRSPRPARGLDAMVEDFLPERRL